MKAVQSNCKIKYLNAMEIKEAMDVFQMRKVAEILERDVGNMFHLGEPFILKIVTGMHRIKVSGMIFQWFQKRLAWISD